MDLSIIIVNWNSVNYLRKCLSSLYRYTNGIEFEVIVLDSGSFDGSGEVLAKEFPDAIFMQSDQNVGFARGNNLAAASSRGDVLLFLNPDTEITGPALQILHDSTLSLPEVGTVGARLFNSDGTVQTSCLQAFPTIMNKLLDAEFFRRVLPRANLWGMAPLFAKEHVPVQVQGISGACLMTPKDVFKRVGGFNEDYFMYYEDMDYCLKVYKAGLKNYFVPHVAIIHHGGKSSCVGHNGFSCVMMAQSAWRYFCKWRGQSYAKIFRIGFTVKATVCVSLLAMAYIATFSKARRNSIRNRLSKWVHIFRWGLGGERRLGTYR